MSNQKQAVYEALEALYTVMPEVDQEAQLAESVEEMLQVLDEAGYDVQVESVEELMGDVEALLQSEELDEGLRDTLSKGVRNVTRALGRTSIGKAIRLKRAASKQQQKYDKLSALKSQAVQSGKDHPFDNPENAREAYAKAHTKQVGMLKRFGAEGSSVDYGQELPKGAKMTDPRYAIKRKAAKISRVAALPAEVKPSPKTPHQAQQDAKWNQQSREANLDSARDVARSAVKSGMW